MSFMNKMRDYLFSETDGADDVFYEENEAPQAQPEYEAPPVAEAPPPPPRRSPKVVNMAGAGSPNLTGMAGSAGSMKMILYQPLSYEDSQAIVDNLRARKPVIVNMVDLERGIAQRVLDFMAGAVYALGGTMRRVSYGIFVIVPSNISIVGNGEDEEKELFRN